MAPPNSAPPNNHQQVLRLPIEEQITFLVLENEKLEDWRLKVDERLGRQEETSKQLTDGMRDLKKLQLRTLRYLRGERSPGFERPGLADDFKALQNKVASQGQEISAIKTTHARIGWILIGLGGFTGISSIAYWKQIMNFLSLFK